MVSAGKPFEEWIGRKWAAEDIVTERLVASFRAIFGSNLARTPEAVAPLGIHWCLAPPIAAMAELGPDGHPAKNRDMPPVPQPRRMWAGGAIESFEPLRIGDRVTRTSEIADITRKQGRSGELWFVIINHEFTTSRGVAVRERQDIVYCEAARSRSREISAPESEDAKPERPRAQYWQVETTAPFLFRYSAVTFNGHRIHYDLAYATGVEGYEGLVVHGPLQATLLFNLAAVVAGKVPAKFEYRGISPAIAGKLEICAGGEGAADSYWTQSPAGQIHMEAKARAA